MVSSKLISRRAWIKKSLTVISVVAFYPFSGSAAETKSDQKITKISARYQDRPHKGEMCGMCKHFIPPGGAAGQGMMGDMMKSMGPKMMRDGHCQIVRGAISPHGYCVYYASI
ncbi:hypothetical protein [Acidihalobacter yilgarnensis]|uniref:hypothetical protein n=1 Tax=Acidihalobacter yilgarnensis TaxID=2819280 RepID=UPI0012EA2B01|nr:hypothetical protein [Acidihalobacter yilgarnensis]